MPNLLYKSLIHLTVLFALSLATVNAGAQNRYTDSLYTIINDTKVNDRDKIIPLSQLTIAVRYYDLKEALMLAQKAVDISRKESDTRYKVYAYTGRENVYLKMRDMERAQHDLDSSLFYAGKTIDNKARAWAWYHNARSLNLAGKEKEALDAALKALSYLKNEAAWELKASIYYTIYGVFATWEEVDKAAQYARLALEAAEKSGNPNNICEAWQAIGTAAHDKYIKTGERDKALLDTAMEALRMSAAIYQRNEPYMNMIQLITIPCINLADAYNRHFPATPQTTDSVRHYATLALNYATKDKDTRLQAAAFGLMNEDAKRNGNYELAETYLIQALSLFVNEPIPDYYIRSNVYRDLAELAERRKDYVQALKYYRSYMADYRKVFDAEQSNTGKKLEAQYQAKEKEQEIRFLKESEALHRRQKYLYIGIAIVLLAGLLFMFRSYHFRLRYSIQRGQLLEKEREEARLLSRLKEEENLLLETEKRNAELKAQLQEEQAKLQAEEATRLQAKQQIIVAQNEILQKEVLAGRLHVEQKNKILQSLKERLLDSSKDIQHAELNKLLKQEERVDSNFEDIKTDLREIQPEFYKKLQQQAGNKLTDLDLKYCAYILMKRSTKEMASLLGVEPKSIRMNKYRLKQKLGLDKEQDLDEFVRDNA